MTPPSGVRSAPAPAACARQMNGRGHARLPCRARRRQGCAGAGIRPGPCPALRASRRRAPGPLGLQSGGPCVGRLVEPPRERSARREALHRGERVRPPGPEPRSRWRMRLAQSRWWRSRVARLRPSRLAVSGDCPDSEDPGDRLPGRAGLSPERKVVTRERHGPCSSRRDRNAQRFGPPGSGPPSAGAGEGGRYARAALAVLVSLRS